MMCLYDFVGNIIIVTLRSADIVRVTALSADVIHAAERASGFIYNFRRVAHLRVFRMQKLLHWT